MKLDETLLSAKLKAGDIARLYFFTGAETFLVKTFAERVVARCLSLPERDFNMMKFEGTPDFPALETAVRTLPVFAEKRVTLIRDFDPETGIKSDETFEETLELFADIPPESVVILAETDVKFDMRKARTKKFFAFLEKEPSAVLCDFPPVTVGKAAVYAGKKAAGFGAGFDRDMAAYLVAAAGSVPDLNVIGTETEKLAAYALTTPEKLITKAMIDALTPKRLELKIFTLSDLIIEKKSAAAFTLLHNLLRENEPIPVIMATLGNAFTDYYRCSLGKARRFPQDKVANDFSYPKNRAWVVGKIMSRGIPAEKAARCVTLLYEADCRMKSANVPAEVILDEAVVKLIQSV
ncbi:hypothetical protein FACS189499_00790 [Clostridia bacterium]|nr:hypothetical protein FACS189499_00790 [Clostridia bacterium]